MTHTKNLFIVLASLAAATTLTTTTVSADTTTSTSQLQPITVVPEQNGLMVPTISKTSIAANATEQAFVPGTKLTYNPQYQYVVTNPDYKIWDQPYNATDDAQQIASPADFPNTQYKVVGTAYNNDNELYVHITSGEVANGWIYSGAITRYVKTQPTFQENLQTTADDVQNMSSIANNVINTGFNALNQPVDFTHKVLNNPIQTLNNMLTIPAGIINIIKGLIPGS